ncbi:MAG: hypothetical protein WB392_01815 [Methanotrichaceae archaeon]
MKKSFSLLLGAILIALLIAELPSDAINENYITVGQPLNTSIINPIWTGYTPRNLPIISLSGVNPAIFDNVAFAKDPGGLSSGSPYTSSINDFLKSDLDAGVSKIARKPLKLGLLVGLGQNESDTYNSSAYNSNAYNSNAYNSSV